MDKNFAIFFGFMLFYLFISEFFTILFRLTGITEETARFQVISMLTTCGFTTAESELIASSKKRRKLAFITILFGYVFTVTMVSIVINFFIQLNKKSGTENLLKELFIIVLLIGTWYTLFKIKPLKNIFNSFISKIGMKLMFKNHDNPIFVLSFFKTGVVAEISITKLPQELINSSLKDSQIKNKYGIQILSVFRNEEPIEVNAETILNNNDKIVIFGNLKSIKSLFVEEKKFI